MDPRGRLYPRDFRSDSADPMFKEMQQQAIATANGGDLTGSR